MGIVTGIIPCQYLSLMTCQCAPDDVFTFGLDDPLCPCQQGKLMEISKNWCNDYRNKPCDIDFHFSVQGEWPYEEECSCPLTCSDGPIEDQMKLYDGFADAAALKWGVDPNIAKPVDFWFPVFSQVNSSEKDYDEFIFELYE
jgi:hypothetical protein